MPTKPFLKDSSGPSAGGAMAEVTEGRLCAVSVDLDEIGHYRDLHGLARRARGGRAVYELALGRIAAFARTEGLPVTFFAVGQDLERAEAARRLGELGRAGHIVENHSWSHRYELRRLGRPRMQDEVVRAQQRIAEVTGRAPQGFRAPGYAVSDTLLDVLGEAGLRYDSSVFACPAYYLAKAWTLARMRLGGRSSRAVLDTPRVLVAPTRPYRPSRPWYRSGGSGLLELPIQVTPGLRLPVIGTSLVMGGRRLARWLARRCLGSPLVNLELHGIDFLDQGDGLADLAPVQPDVRIGVGRKRAALEAAVGVWRAAGYRFVTLDQAAAQLSAER